MHTPLCRHATGQPVEYARRARAIGLTEIGFTDHSPMERDDFDDWRMLERELVDYLEAIEVARNEVPEVRILAGLEVDFLPGHEDWIQQLSERCEWDYFIGSVHYISNDWAIDNPSFLSRWQEEDPYEVWCRYFELLGQAAASGLFEIIGHADLPKKFGIWPDRDCTPLYAALADAVADAGIAIELNTAGLRKDCREIYPHRALLELAHQ